MCLCRGMCQAQQQHHPGGLGANGKKGGHRRRCALVNIRRPNLEGERGDLEAQSRQHHKQAEVEYL